MIPLKWAAALLRRVAPPDRTADVLGDLEEAHRKRVQRRGRTIGNLLTAFETLDVAFGIWRTRWRVPDLGISWIDLKLALRMLVKNPGLSIVAVFALAVGIPLGLYPAHLASVMETPLPVPEGDRIQMLRYRNVATSGTETPSLQDFLHWRGELTTFESVAAATLGDSYNVISEDGRAAPV